MCQAISGAYFLAAAQTLFANRLLQTLKATSPNIAAVMAISTGASEIQHIFVGDDLSAVTNAYMVGIQDVFAFALASSAFAVLLAFMIPFKKLPDYDNNKRESKEITA